MVLLLSAAAIGKWAIGHRGDAALSVMLAAYAVYGVVRVRNRYAPVAKHENPNGDVSPDQK